jgi:hypothetical protein
MQGNREGAIDLLRHDEDDARLAVRLVELGLPLLLLQPVTVHGSLQVGHLPPAITRQAKLRRKWRWRPNQGDMQQV